MSIITAPPLSFVDPNGVMHLNFHKGQLLAWNSDSSFLMAFIGTTTSAVQQVKTYAFKGVYCSPVERFGVVKEGVHINTLRI